MRYISCCTNAYYLFSLRIKQLNAGEATRTPASTRSSKSDYDLIPNSPQAPPVSVLKGTLYRDGQIELLVICFASTGSFAKHALRVLGVLGAVQSFLLYHDISLLSVVALFVIVSQTLLPEPSHLQGLISVQVRAEYMNTPRLAGNDVL